MPRDFIAEGQQRKKWEESHRPEVTKIKAGKALDIASAFMGGYNKSVNKNPDVTAALTAEIMKLNVNAPKGMYTGNTKGNIATKSATPDTKVYPQSENLKHLQNREGPNNTYTTKNAAGSSAYGKYQFMPNTAKEIANRIGIDPEKWTEPANQDAIYKQADKDYEAALNRWDVKDTPGNRYAIHQLGAGRAKRLFRDVLTEKDKKVMKDQIPKAKQTEGMNIVDVWSDLFL